MTQRWWMYFPLCPWWWRQGVAPAIALHIAGTWRGNPPFVIVALAVAVTIAIAVAISVLAASVAIAITVAHRCRRRPLPLWLPLTTATTVSVALPSAIAIAVAVTVAVAVSHCRLRHQQPLQLPSLLAITITIAVSHFRELLPWCTKNCIQPIEAKNAYLILFCSDSGWRTDQSRMTDQVSSSNGQHQRWVASGKHWGKWLVREVAGSRGAAGGQQGGDVDWPWEELFCCVVGVSAVDRWRLWWCVGCGRRHCRWDSDWTDARGKGD